MERILERFERNFDVRVRLARECTLINGRADAVYHRFVIKYEPPTPEPSMASTATSLSWIERPRAGLASMSWPTLPFLEQ